MKTKLNHSILVAALCAVAIIASVVSAGAQDAPGKRKRAPKRDRHVARSGTYENSKGRSGTFEQTVDRKPGERIRGTEWQNQNGGQGSRHVDNTWDKTTGTGTHEAQTTLPSGKTTSSQGTITKTDTGFEYDGTHTGRNGKTSTIDSTLTKTGQGSATVDKTITGPNGKTTTVDKTITKTDDGRTITGTVTGPNGQTSTFDKDISRTHNDDGSVTRTTTKDLTDPQGNQHTRTNSVTATRN